MKWNKGAPPHIGWWLSKVLDSNVQRWRWFDGRDWSMGVEDSARNDFAGSYAIRTAGAWLVDEVFWSDYYPKNARVPRINPNKKVKK